MSEFECNFRSQYKYQKQYFRQRASPTSQKKNELFRKHMTREKLLILRIEEIELLNLTLNIIENYKRDTKI